MKLPSRRMSPRPTLSAPEVYDLADAIGPRWRAFVLVSAFAGLRYAEGAALRRCSVSFPKGTLDIDHSITKSGEVTSLMKSEASRSTLLVSERALDALRSHIEQFDPDYDALLFRSPQGSPLRYDNFRRRQFNPAAEAIGRPEITTHALRHSDEAMLEESDLGPGVLQVAMRHGSATTTLKHYSHPPSDAHARAVRAIDSAVESYPAPLLPRSDDVSDIRVRAADG